MYPYINIKVKKNVDEKKLGKKMKVRVRGEVKVHGKGYMEQCIKLMIHKYFCNDTNLLNLCILT
jgi:hypothetical protein